MSSYNNSPLGNPIYMVPISTPVAEFDSAIRSVYAQNMNNSMAAVKDIVSDISEQNKNHGGGSFPINPGHLHNMNNPVGPPAPPTGTAIPDIDLVAAENQIRDLRSKLDEQLRELYSTENSILSDVKMELDVTVYTGILWTILATATVYYLFIEL